MTIFSRLLANSRKLITNRFLSSEIRSQVRAALAAETESTITLGSRQSGTSDRDRYAYDRDKVLSQALKAWRVNPIARRIVELTSQYVVGEGFVINCKDEKSAKFLQKFWSHRLNHMPVRVSEWCDELTRSGNLFILVSTDSAGMTYVRAIPASDIEKIDHLPNDVEQATSFQPKGKFDNLNPSAWPAYNEDTDSYNGSFSTVMLHYSINRPVGAQWGESDLACSLKWLSRYANWLEDRARLNRFRTAFLYVVTGQYQSEADRISRQSHLNANPPSPGSILVCDEGETWSVISPRLESHEAGADGLALKKMIASGAGVPLHFLAEPESATRTTAEAAGGPTYRHFEERQCFFIYLLEDLFQVVLNRRSLVDRNVIKDAEFTVKGSDISSRDNVALALSASYIRAAAANLRDRGLIDDAEFIRLVYRFSNEAVDIEDILARGAAAPPPLIPVDDQSATGDLKVTVDPETGEVQKNIDNPIT